MTATKADQNDLRKAIYHLVNCWDALREIEVRNEGAEIEVDALQDLAGSCGPADDALTLNEDALQTIFDGVSL